MQIITEVRARRVPAGHAVARARGKTRGGSAEGWGLKVTDEQGQTIRRPAGEVAWSRRSPGQTRTAVYAYIPAAAATGTDYLVAGGALAFKPGETSNVVTVQVKGDARVEADERFRVVLYQATGAVVADGTGVGTIKNDDAPPAPRVSVADARVVEGDKGTKAVTFDVALDRAAASVVNLKYATADGTAKAGSDYLAAAGVLAFRPGETRKRVTVYVKGDKGRERGRGVLPEPVRPGRRSADPSAGRSEPTTDGLTRPHPFRHPGGGRDTVSLPPPPRAPRVRPP